MWVYLDSYNDVLALCAIARERCLISPHYKFISLTHKSQLHSLEPGASPSYPDCEESSNHLPLILLIPHPSIASPTIPGEYPSIQHTLPLLQHTDFGLKGHIPGVPHQHTPATYLIRTLPLRFRRSTVSGANTSHQGKCAGSRSPRFSDEMGMCR